MSEHITSIRGGNEGNKQYRANTKSIKIQIWFQRN